MLPRIVKGFQQTGVAPLPAVDLRPGYNWQTEVALQEEYEKGIVPREGWAHHGKVFLQEGNVCWMVVSLQSIVFGQQGSTFSGEKMSQQDRVEHASL
jgi:hypothetical protein